MHCQHHEDKAFKTGKTQSRNDGIHAFGITIDEEVRDYLPHMHAVANNMLIDDIAT
jgi:nitric oxide reductase activation protein